LGGRAWPRLTWRRPSSRSEPPSPRWVGRGVGGWRVAPADRPALGLVGGAGALPALMAREAQEAGWRLVVFALAEPAAPLPPGDAGLLADARRGLEAARALGRLCIGQTVVVKAGTVVAVEAMEGTDETIRRGLALAGPGASVVKAPAPGHDYRFDVPAIGPDTVARCAAGQARILAVEAERVLLLDRDTVATEASRAGLTVIGLGETTGDR